MPAIVPVYIASGWPTGCVTLTQPSAVVMLLWSRRGVLLAMLTAEMPRIGDLPGGAELVGSLPSLYTKECRFRRALGLKHDDSVAERIGRQLTAPQSPDVTACTIVDSLFGPTHAARLRELFDQRGWPGDPLGATSTPPRTARSSPPAPNRRSKTPRGLASIASGMVGVPTPAKDRAKASRDREKALMRVGADAQRDLDRWSLSLAALAGIGLFCVPTYHLKPSRVVRTSFGDACVFVARDCCLGSSLSTPPLVVTGRLL